MMAFSCTCQPNRYEANPHKVNEDKKLLNVGFLHSFCNTTCQKKGSCFISVVAKLKFLSDSYQLNDHRDQHGMNGFNCR
jgi:hypothetical protein